MKTRIVRIGNSQGVRIPKPLLEQSGLGEEVELEVRADEIVIRAGSRPRAGWEEAFRSMADAGDDEARRAARRADAEAAGLRRIVRHLVTNTRFLELTPERARVSSYFTVITEIGLDHHGRYRDELEPVGDEWLIRHRFVSTDWRDPGSTMAPPSAIG